ncbi:Orotidine 5'-phosphate decarboxylase [Buchnera aphidicola (Takecallis arundicolens)]|uniref:orotidine-5'-phosphate decarboxylase n=1 Tax=Buchnera aphidicola TaxID=9 RepID=UPI003464AF2C
MSQINLNQKNPEIIIALDYDDKKSIFELIDKLDPSIFKLKIGHCMFIKFGISLIKEIKKLNFDIFVDLKLYDIPNIIFKSIVSIAELGVWMTSIHASGGGNMMEHAKLALNNFVNPPLLIAITALTSFTGFDLSQTGVSISLSNYIVKLSELTKSYKLNGIVCPGYISKKIKQILGNDFKIIVPGIRFINHDQNDQNLITYIEEIKRYSIDYIVIGRTITSTSNPIQTLHKILNYIHSSN